MNPKYFTLARNVSKYSSHRVRVGAVIVKKRPIGIGYNVSKTHPIHADPYTSVRSSIHAEIRAIMNCNEYDLRDSVAYVYRETKDGNPALARPCNYCYSMLQSIGVKRIYYSISEFPYWKMEDL